MNGVAIHEVPKFLMMNPTTSTHSILVADPTDAAHPYTILLQLEGVVSYFEYALPTSAKYEDEDIPHLELTAAAPAWDPYDKYFAALKRAPLISGDIWSLLHGVMVHAEWQRRGHFWPTPFVMRNPIGNLVQFPCSTMLPILLTTITWAQHWKRLARWCWYELATPQSHMTFVESTRVNGRGPWTTLLWPIVGRYAAQGQEDGAADYTARRAYGLAPNFVMAFSNKQLDVSLSEDVVQPL
jgi:hypothetical protein